MFEADVKRHKEEEWHVFEHLNKIMKWKWKLFLGRWSQISRITDREMRENHSGNIEEVAISRKKNEKDVGKLRGKKHKEWEGMNGNEREWGGNSHESI